MPATTPCTLPNTRDVIEWHRAPRVEDNAVEVGEVNLEFCRPTLDGWKASEATGDGYCGEIAWASDNPGYNADARLAPRLKNVIDEVGDC
jgi:hypothetical protein